MDFNLFLQQQKENKCSKQMKIHLIQRLLQKSIRSSWKNQKELRKSNKGRLNR